MPVAVVRERCGPSEPSELRERSVCAVAARIALVVLQQSASHCWLLDTAVCKVKIPLVNF